MRRPGAPLVVKDKVIVGMAGGERGVSGFLDAYDREDREAPLALQYHSSAGRAELRHLGRRLVEDRRRVDLEYRIATIPTRTRFSGARATRGPTTTTICAPATTCIPCSVLALDPDTGKLKWHYQFTPHDTARLGRHAEPGAGRHRVPRTAAQGARVAEPQRILLSHRSDQRKIPLGESVREADVERRLRLREQRTAESWCPGNDPTPEGNDKVWPGIDGGANWMSHSYSPLTKLLYVFAREERRVFTKNAIQHPTTDPAATPQAPNAGPVGGRVRGGYDDCLVVGIDCNKRLAHLRRKKASVRPSRSIRQPARRNGSIPCSRLPGAD